MTLFFTLVALVHVAGLYAMLLAVRRAPVAVESNRGFTVIAEREEAQDAIAAMARVA